METVCALSKIINCINTCSFAEQTMLIISNPFCYIFEFVITWIYCRTLIGMSVFIK